MRKGVQYILSVALSLAVLTAAAQTKTVKKTITVPNNGSVFITNPRVNSETCLGPNNGNIQVDVSGGQSPYTFEWYNGNDGGGTLISTNDYAIGGLAQDDYSVVVTDQAGCSSIENFTVGYSCPYTNCSSMTLNFSPTNTTSCSSHNGELMATMGPIGIGPFNYTVSKYNPFTDVHTVIASGSQPAASTFNLGPITGLDAGEYQIEVEDVGNGCTKSQVANIENDGFYAYSAYGTDLYNCVSPDGTIVMDMVASGPPNMRVRWKTTDGTFSGTRDFTGTTYLQVTQAPVGYFIVEVEDLNSPGCVTSEFVSVSAYMADINVTLNEINDQTTCDPPNGSIDVIISGGSGDYAYQWYGGPTSGTSEDHNGIEAGDYNLYVLDKVSGCTQDPSTPVFPVSAVLASPQLSASIIDNSNCAAPFNGSIDLTAADTPGPYAYDWYDLETSTIFSNVEDPSDLPPASYRVIVRDLSTGCKDTLDRTVIDTSIPSVNLSETVTPSTGCLVNFGNGAIDMSITTASHPYSVSWTGPFGFTSTSEDIGPLSGGDYTISVQVSCSLVGNTAPVVARSHPSIAYISPGIKVDDNISATDDGTTLSSATVTITAGLSPANDMLAFDPAPGISGSYSAATGVLTLSGVATLNDYQNTLRSVYYTNSGSSTTTRIVSYVVSDGSLSSNVQTVDINFTPNAPPALSSTVTGVNYSSGTLVINNLISVSDSDDSNIESATISISSGLVSAEDVLSSTAVAGITPTFNAATGTLTLTGSATLASYQTALQSVTYQNTNTGDRNKNQRVISFTVNDGVANSNTITSTVDLPNQSPATANSGANPAYVSGTLAVAPSITLSDTDNATLQSATLTISNGLQIGEDVLLFTNQNGITGSYNTPSGVLTLTGSASLANYQVAIRSVTYDNIATGDRIKVDRTVSILVNDGLTNSNAVNITINIPNQLPTVTNASLPPLYGSGAILIADQFMLFDTDNVTIQSALISISGGFTAAEDRLIFTDQNGISGSFNSSSGVLTLTGAASKGNYVTAIRTIQYQNISATPAENVRIISISVNDGMGTSSAATVNVTINHAPSITSPQTEAVAGESLQINIISLISDPDNNVDFDNINSITIQTQPISGATASIADGILTLDYSPVPDFTGTDRLSIQACDVLDRCAVQELSIQVGAELIVYNAVSPNNDDLNDYLFLRFINAQNNVKIFNRWGDKVFEVSNYDNDNEDKRFEGKNDNGSELPSGTYFYKIEQPGGVTSGYLSLKH